MNKAKGILFTTEMIKSLRAGRKGMTRRLVKPQPSFKKNVGKWIKNNRVMMIGGQEVVLEYMLKHCPWKIGDILWVRESWKIVGWDWDDGTMNIEYADDTKGFDCNIYDPNEDSQWLVDKIDALVGKGIMKELDATDDESHYLFTDKKHGFYPSIHMPKECCRIWLEVTDIKLERIADISTEDAILEGIEPFYSKNGVDVSWKDYIPPSMGGLPARLSFKSLIESIHGTEVWERNDWVWCISFKIVEKPKWFLYH